MKNQLQWIVADQCCPNCYAIKQAQRDQRDKAEKERRDRIHRQMDKVSIGIYDPLVFLQNIDKKTFVAFDFQTTGLNYYDSEIIEIGAVLVENGNVTKRFSQFVRPSTGVVPGIITNITGITTDMVKNVQDIHQVLPQFLQFVGDYPVVSHNLKFDGEFLIYAMCDCEITDKKINGFDTLKTAQSVWKRGKDVQNHKLGTLCEFIGYDLHDAHRAVNDAQAAAALTMALARVMKKDIQAEQIVDKLVDYLRQNVPCLQKNVPMVFPDYDPNAVKQAINKLERAGRITKGKQGSSVSIESIT